MAPSSICYNIFYELLVMPNTTFRKNVAIYRLYGTIYLSYASRASHVQSRIYFPPYRDLYLRTLT